MNLLEFQEKFSSEQVCLQYLEEMRWPQERYCPHCGSTKTYKFSSGKLFKCGDCRKQFTAKIGTIFSDSKVPLSKWFMAIYLSTSLKKGISSMQLSRYIGVTQKTAWFMLQRIRYALEQTGGDDLLQDIVEVDETYVGGKRQGKRGRGAEGKTPVVGAAQRQGKVVAKAVSNTKTTTVRQVIRDNVKIGSRIVTDEYRSYNKTTNDGYEHSRINHSAKQYVDGDIHINTIEGFWSHLKRGIDGVYHHVSPKHLQKYCSEYEYRYNTRTSTDYERFGQWFNCIICRLTYRNLICE